MELKSKFDHLDTQKDKYKGWVENEVFKADLNSKKIPFSIVLPPPNVTGKLHLGHAWDGTLQDILIRYKKMQGFETMWIPGMDHAGIATQAKVDEKLREQGTDRFKIGRNEFMKVAWEWKEEYAQFIREQWGMMGFALDYSQEKFTLDNDVNKSVNKVFVTLYEQGLIYQ
ncbi:MAG: class I tRNA ligase family protein, partial [Mycoplasmatales bacterium]